MVCAIHLVPLFISVSATQTDNTDCKFRLAFLDEREPLRIKNYVYNTRLKMEKNCTSRSLTFYPNQILGMINLLVSLQCSMNLENLYPRRYIYFSLSLFQMHTLEYAWQKLQKDFDVSEQLGFLEFHFSNFFFFLVKIFTEFWQLSIILQIYTYAMTCRRLTLIEID